MIKVLHIIDWLCLGGAARSMIANAKYSARSGQFEHRLVSLKSPDPMALELAESSGMKFLPTSGHASILKAIDDVDIVHIHYWNNPKLFEFLQSELPEMRLLIWFHVAGEYPPQVITKDLVDYGDFAIPCNPYSYELPVFQKLPNEVRVKKIGMVYDAADFERVVDVKPKPHDTFNVGYIGSVSFSKMHQNYVSISAAVDIPNVQFIVCGGGAEDYLKKQAQEIGAVEKFDFRGFVEDIKSVIETLDIYGYPLCEDTYAAAELNLQEIMYAGIPPVVFPHGGIKRLVINNYTGLVAQSESEYTQAIEYLYHHPEERLRLGRNAKEYAQQLFGAENAAKQLNPIYQKLMQLPKQKREWGIPMGSTLLDQPLSLLDVVIPSDKFMGARAFIQSLGHQAQPFTVSLTSDNIEHLLAAEHQIAESSILLGLGEGGVHQYRDYYLNDGYLRLWLGLILINKDRNHQAISELQNAINLGCNHWRVFWYLAQAAEQVQNIGLAENAVNQVLGFVPNFTDAQEMLQRLQVLLVSDVTHLELKEINLIIFPDWKQPEESVCSELMRVIKALINHPDKSHIKLLIDHQNMADEEADLILSSVVMNLLMEEELDIEQGPDISLLGELTQPQWLNLLSIVQGRISLDLENLAIIEKFDGIEIPEFSLETLLDWRGIELKNGSWELWKLKEQNYIVFPDWQQPEETLYLELAEVFKAIASLPNKSQITLYINSQNIPDEDANLILSSLIMNLLMETELDVTEALEILLTGQLTDLQAQGLLPHLTARIVLDHEDKNAIASFGAEIIPIYDLTI
ncbi:glycosyltransferase [Planktothrix agardhii 1801]|jgi:glycosyltransferase involved in cell wall biosynthesis|uniref:glycosyltransferase n=1 Tax=Planktothrix agardhii TaxID=1160 RepID=UPI001F1FDB49|nr:glycosyltransferase [Planktothrix agardhii]MCF3625725.1 glycosyltransferase [Planktothrix agardhii 1801]